ncbi:MAG: tetratricopeptide repeat protein, partial [Candidatus Zixiibacteriota bacterium]
NQWSYFPPAIALLSGAFVLLFFIPSLNEVARRGLNSLASRVISLLDSISGLGGKRRYLGYFVFSALFFIPFWLLRERVYFLGDGAQIISRLSSGEFGVHWAEPLETFLHIKIFGLADRLWQMDSSTIYAILSCLAGLVFVFLALLLADFWGKERREKVLIFLILLSMGSTQLFFGYVEHYSFLYVFVFAFILSSLGYLKGKVKWFVPLTAFVLASLSHVSSLYLFPSLLFLFATKGRNGKSSSIRRTLILGLGLVFVGLLLAVYKKYAWTISPIFVPLSEDTYAAPGYLLFSLPHILDFANQQLLTSPVGLIMLLAPLACMSAKSLFKKSAFQFLLLVSAFQLLFGFLVDPDLGASRDWDLFSVAGLGYTILGLFILLNLLREKPRFAYLSLILVLTSLYSTVPWILVNSHEQKSISRFQNLLEIDVKKSYSGHFVLIKHFKARGMNEEAEKQDDKYHQAFPEIVLSNEGTRLAKEGEFEQAERLYLEAEQLSPKRPEIHNNLGYVYLKLGRLGMAEVELNRAVQLGTHLPAAYVNLADLHLMRQDYDRALDACRKAIRLKTDSPQTYSNAATIYLTRGQLKEAEDHFRGALALDRNLTKAYVGLGDIYNQISTPRQAVRMYHAALKLNPDLAMARFRLGMTYLSLNARQEAKRELESFLLLSPQGPEADKAREVLNTLKELEIE